MPFQSSMYISMIIYIYRYILHIVCIEIWISWITFKNPSANRSSLVWNWRNVSGVSSSRNEAWCLATRLVWKTQWRGSWGNWGNHPCIGYIDTTRWCFLSMTWKAFKMQNEASFWVHWFLLCQLSRPSFWHLDLEKKAWPTSKSIKDQFRVSTCRGSRSGQNLRWSRFDSNKFHVGTFWILVFNRAWEKIWPF